MDAAMEKCKIPIKKCSEDLYIISLFSIYMKEDQCTFFDVFTKLKVIFKLF